MRLERLEVRDFRGIRAATIAFGPGLTVLHGPNELGKSTLVEAIHAALFLQSTSQAGNEHVTWGGSIPRVRDADLRARRQALARVQAIRQERFRETRVQRERGVSEVQRSRGGKRCRRRVAEAARLGHRAAWRQGSLRRRPKASCSRHSLGRQGAVQEVLNTSLGGDSDDTGKSLVTQAIGALDKDPLVSRIVEQLAERVETVFTPQGKLKTAADSPVVKLQDQLRAEGGSPS